MRTSLKRNAPRTGIRPGGWTLVKTVCLNLRRLNINVSVEEIDHIPPPWRIPLPAVSYTSASKTDLPLPQKQQGLEAIDRVTSFLPAPHLLYADGSLQTDGRGRVLCCFLTQYGITTRRLGRPPSTTLVELYLL